ncbi:hypothetical protein YK48G_21580 [Lentilactobacillus fungorum]|uniref:Surface layer protein A domain-containing protein n=1 Tax=Lentilactobacillus fungorum TaxID=2201250 RepID=A0ABQ3W0N6_9LACO|nr:hypothetical protein [Lentilactobacillus fungorum]GHP14733.1 hypothetical protein YK48G_21580 [Lentilactobacillus fungorum]
MNLQKTVIMSATFLSFFIINSVDAHGSAYHVGTPKALQGCWYLGKTSYLEYWAHHTGTNTLKYSSTYWGYYKPEPYGLTYVKYRYLGARTYRITGWNYATNQDFRIILPNSQRYTYDVRLLNDHYLYLFDRKQVYQKYAKTPSWIVE